MSFLNQDRLKVYPRIFIALYLAISIYWFLPGIINGPPWADRQGKPIGSDFPCFWTASHLVVDLSTASLYRPAEFYKAEKESTGIFYPLPWQYPPTYLLMVLPLSLAPYLLSLLLFLCITGTAYILVVGHITRLPGTGWLLLAFPATFQNIIHGQNAFLTTSLLGGGLLLVDHYPATAGVLFGLLTFKPHLAVLVPIALIFSRSWKCLSAMLSTVAVLVSVSLILFGRSPWLEFFHNIGFATSALSTGSQPLFKMPTVFAAMVLAGAPSVVALAFQAVVAAAGVLLVAWAWHRRLPLYVRVSVLTTAVFFVTPHALDYDLALLALPLAWLGRELSKARILTPVEEAVLILVWVSPLIISPLAKLTHVQVGPLLLASLLVIMLRVHRRTTEPVLLLSDRAPRVRS
jgi:hypothetical protein